MIYYAINAVGAFGPQLSLFLALLFLRHKPALMIVYSFGFIINALISYTLKGLFKQPRPTDETTSFNLEQIYRKKQGFERYGMPSGHAQTVFYSSAFLYFALKDGNINIIMAILSLVTLFQRLESRHHTLAQVIVGAIVGSLIGYAFFNYGEKQVKGLLKAKRDDNVKRRA
jgi:membrane-associated phospholipid phosphatase